LQNATSWTPGKMVSTIGFSILELGSPPGVQKKVSNSSTVIK